MSAVDSLLGWLAIGAAASLAGMMLPFLRGGAGVVVKMLLGPVGAILGAVISHVIASGESPAEQLTFAAVGALVVLGLVSLVLAVVNLLQLPLGLIGPFTTLHAPQVSGAAGRNCWQFEQTLAGSSELSTYASDVRTCASAAERLIVSEHERPLGSDLPQPVVPTTARTPNAALF